MRFNVQKYWRRYWFWRVSEDEREAKRRAWWEAWEY